MFIIEEFEKFKENFNNEDEIFKEYSQIFRNFWETLILNDDVSVLDDSDIDPIIRLIDINGKGNTKNSIAVAKALIRMGQWYRAFRSIKSNDKIKKCISKIFNSDRDIDLIKYLNEFEKINQELKNGLTGKSAIILNGLLYLYNPSYYVSALSLDHRNKMVKYLYGTDVSNETFGEKIINTNRMILDYFKNKSILASPRTISCFLYKIKNIWDNSSEIIEEEINEKENINNEEQMFVLEKYFEDFLVGNWETTALGKKYTLIYSDEGELLSQQYKTDIGKIDLLVKEKNTDNYVVIELKRNQSSDDTVGQISRYMGWIKERIANNSLVKGIIISYSKDDKLYYALKAVPNIELLLYRINFSLIDPK